MFSAAILVETVFKAMGAECIITSANDGKHRADSLHYVGFALDFRTRVLPDDRWHELYDKVRAALPDDYIVILEADHLHIQYQHRSTYLAALSADRKLYGGA